MKLTATQKRIVALWQAHPASRTKHRQRELERLVWRDLRRTARRAVRERGAA